jgi:hypothetical protein
VSDLQKCSFQHRHHRQQCPPGVLPHASRTPQVQLVTHATSYGRRLDGALSVDEIRSHTHSEHVNEHKGNMSLIDHGKRSRAFTSLTASSTRAVISYPCGRGDRASPVFVLRSFRSRPYVRRRPCPVLFWGQPVRVRCTPGNGWQSRAYLASARIPQSKRRRFGSEKP